MLKTPPNTPPEYVDNAIKSATKGVIECLGWFVWPLVVVMRSALGFEDLHMLSENSLHFDGTLLHVLDHCGPMFFVVKAQIWVFKLDSTCHLIIHSLPLERTPKVCLDALFSTHEEVKYPFVLLQISAVNVDLGSGVIL